MTTLEDIKPQKITADFNGEQKELIFDLNAYANIEEQLGSSIPNAFSMLESGSMKAVRAFLWAGLLHQDKSLKIEEVGRLVNLEGVIDAIAAAVEASMPKGENV